MKISMIAAMTKHRVIGLNNNMPWHLPADLKHFKKVTLGKPVIMGRKTFESIGKPLPGRKNIVISRNKELSIEGAQTAESVEQALALVSGVNEVMIIGGGNIYNQCLSKCNTLYLTFIDLEVEGDTFFPNYEQESDWIELSKETHPSDSKNPYNYSFVTLSRV